MTWQLFVGVSILLYSVNALLHRILMKEADSDPYAQTIAFYGLVGLFAFFIAVFRDGFQYRIPPDLFPYFIIITIFAALTSVLGFRSIQLIEASESSILGSTSRIWVLFGAFIFLKEEFSINKLVGTFLILISVIVVQWKNKRFVINEGIIFAVLASISFAITETASYYILRKFDATSFAVYTNWLPVIAFLFIRPKSFKRLTFYLKRKNAFNILLVSASDVFASLFRLKCQKELLSITH
ncbi:MAG: hypothetical protein UT63_C0068G0017 [Candidatus Gottesmanbacteria bacterium GW2011_GWC2_39_8]|uniref:EamA domain-containing protein n=1 Tax=Candidatus Gottesmanbacteria bacterium GW2011_GWC2_39_8 TaxID=1618450 RepID=A0A0G0T0X1_9BACT|nr:MAG: hypothetical protein UT63_C0068G0017 [Candidatus Gottesmanbacteria bacterium GW2011_GWC2_39_8]